MRRATLLMLAALLLPAAQAQAQSQGRITGKVLNELGRPLSGAQVQVMGTGLGAVTEANGSFTIGNVPAGRQAVRATMLGFGAAEDTVPVAAGQTATVELRLQPQAVQLEGIVAIGYGTQAKEEVTGAVASVKEKDFVQAPAQDAAALIKGKIAGVNVITPSGDPTAGTQIRLRGTTTITGNRDPLVLIDGVPGDLGTVAPQDIESISVLKDGSAAAVYGSRASNGVILITTKRYHGGGPTIRYEGYASYQSLYNSPDFLTAADYRDLISQGYSFEDMGYTTDWQDQVLRNPWSYVHNVTLMGGSAGTSYTASLNYQNAQGIFQRSDNKHLTGRARISHSMYDGRLRADVEMLSGSRTQFMGPDYHYAWRQTLIRNPTDRVMDDDGNWQERGTYFYTNPVGLINEENGSEEDRDLRLHGTLTFQPLDQLKLSIMGGTDRWDRLDGSATTFRHVNTTQSGLNGTASRGTASSDDRILELTGTYADNFGKNDVTVLGGYSYQDSEYEWFNAYNYDFPTDLFSYNSLGSGNALGEGKADMGSGKTSYKLIGFFGRLNYEWDHRFLLMGSLRYEGNTRFGADHKWGMFPAISAGWRLANEAFIRHNAPWINELKLRVGYGVTGIAPTSSYLSLTSYSYGSRFLYDGNWVQGISPARNPNPDLRWEQKQETNVGVDFALFDSRLSGSVDAYRRDTKDMLYGFSVPVPPYLYGSILANVGHMRNTGLEAALSYDVIRSPNASWTTSVNGSTNSNRLLSLSSDVFQSSDYFYPGDGYTGEPIQMPTHRVDIGGPIGNFYGYKSVGVDSTGAWIVLDKDNNPISIRDASEDDRHVLGNGLPKYYLAWNNSARYKNFDLNVNMRGAFGFQILNFQRMFYENPTITQYNMLKSAFDPVYGQQQLNYDLAYVSYYIEDGDYWKVDNVTLGYTLGDRVLGALSGKVQNARIYVSGSNLLTITGYKGMDPEVPVDGLAPGNDQRDKYPTTRRFTAGVSVTF